MVEEEAAVRVHGPAVHGGGGAQRELVSVRRRRRGQATAVRDDLERGEINSQFRQLRNSPGTQARRSKPASMFFTFLT